MELFCIGLSHKTAPLDLREQLALPNDAQLQLLARLKQTVGEAMLLSTCNRFELYGVCENDDSKQAVRAMMHASAGAHVSEHLYEHSGDGALVHLFRVASSLDSMVVGEPQILGQVKDAYEMSRTAGLLRHELTRVCGAAFSAAKRVRTETGVGRAATSMASAAVELANKVLGSLAGKTILLVGAGEMAKLAARHLKSAGATELVFTNRTFARAETLAKQLGARAEPFDKLSELLIRADVVICSTASQTPIITRALLSTVLKPRKHRSLFMVDLAVPRDIESAVNELPGVFAYDVDDIEKVVAENAAARAQEAARAETIIAEEIAHFIRSRNQREGVPVLAKLRSHAQQIAQSEVEKTLGALGPALDERGRRSVEAMAMAIVNKLLHHPTSRLRAESDDQTRRLAGAAEELFGLDGSASKDSTE